MYRMRTEKRSATSSLKPITTLMYLFLYVPCWWGVGRGDMGWVSRDATARCWSTGNPRVKCERSFDAHTDWVNDCVLLGYYPPLCTKLYILARAPSLGALWRGVQAPNLPPPPTRVNCCGVSHFKFGRAAARCNASKLPRATYPQGRFKYRSKNNQGVIY